MSIDTIPASGRVKSVTAVQTGSGDAHREHVFGSRKPALWWIFFTKRSVRIPIHVFVIEHEQGLVLFDTGMDRRAVTDPNYFPDKITAFFMDHIFAFHLGPEDTLTRQLQIAGIQTESVSKAVISHLHFDHVGGIREIPQAELYVSDAEWQHMLGAHPEREGILRRDIDIPNAKWNQVVFQPTDDPALVPFTEAFDLLGDGSMTLLPTPGHTPGSMSMFVQRSDAPPLLLIGDLAYDADALERNQFPGTGDKDVLRVSYQKVREFKSRYPGLIVVPSHDVKAIQGL
jgi:glyoxylase-like metal-dependent hydrolase (beta-lactamase superfamily II)